MTPGSARAWTAKQAVGRVSGSGKVAESGDMAILLGNGKTANDNGPILDEDRGANSPNPEELRFHGPAT
jgi:hypothetical protein